MNVLLAQFARFVVDVVNALYPRGYRLTEDVFR